MICYICRENVVIPVELTCFECFQVNKLHCNSYVRICLDCAIQYLELHKSPLNRILYRKCLTCQQVCFPFQLNFNNSYMVDFLQMKNDTNVHTCSYCNEFSGKSIEILHHLNDCPDFFVNCKCNQVIVRKDFFEHCKNCPFHTVCEPCKKTFDNFEYIIHLQEVHGEMVCQQCNQIIKIDNLFQHLRHECKKRNMFCFACNEFVTFDNFEQHLLEHEEEYREQIKKIEKEYVNMNLLYRFIQNKRTNLFHNYYLTE